MTSDVTIIQLLITGIHTWGNCSRYNSRNKLIYILFCERQFAFEVLLLDTRWHYTEQFSLKARNPIFTK